MAATSPSPAAPAIWWPETGTVLNDGFVRDRAGAGCGTTGYCTAKVNSLGCTPLIAASGTPSATAGSGFSITAANEISHKHGALFYGTTGRTAIVFPGRLPVRRRADPADVVQGSGGTPPPSDCSARFAFDFNVRIASGVDPNLVPGAVVDCQYWSRDPGFAPPDNTSLTAGLEFTILP
jgi:hypothetical protein